MSSLSWKRPLGLSSVPDALIREFMVCVLGEAFVEKRGVRKEWHGVWQKKCNLTYK